MPSCALVPLPNSSMRQRDRAVAWRKMAAICTRQGRVRSGDRSHTRRQGRPWWKPWTATEASQCWQLQTPT